MKATSQTQNLLVRDDHSDNEPSSLTNYRPLNESIHCCLGLYSLSKKLLFIPAAGALAGVHIDHLLLASNAQRSEIQPLVLQGQIVSADFPLLTDGQTDNCQPRIVQYQGSPPYALVTSMMATLCACLLAVCRVGFIILCVIKMVLWHGIHDYNKSQY